MPTKVGAQTQIQTLPTIRVVPATPPPQNSPMSLPQKPLPVVEESPARPEWMAAFDDSSASNEEDSFQGRYEGGMSSSSNGGVEYRTHDDAFIEEDSEPALSHQMTPRTPRPDSPYPAETISSGSTSHSIRSSPRIPSTKRISLTSNITSNIPPPIQEGIAQSAVPNDIHLVQNIIIMPQNNVDVPNSAALITALQLAPKEKFEGGHFRRIRSRWIRRVLRCSRSGGDGSCCSECGTEWKDQSYGKRCEGGFHFMDREGKLYEFVGDRFAFEDGS